MNKQKLKQKGILAGIMFTAILTGVGGCGRKQEEAPPKQEETAVKEPIQPELPEKTVTEEKKEPETKPAEETEKEEVKERKPVPTVEHSGEDYVKAKTLHVFEGVLSQLQAAYALPFLGNVEADTDNYSMSDNQFAIADVDGDGRPELIINYTAASLAGNFSILYDYNAEKNELKQELVFQPSGYTFYNNGVLTVPASQNHSLRLDFWPYTLYRYDAKTDTYQSVGYVSSWQKDYAPESNTGEVFPDEFDKDEDGILYGITAGETDQNNDSAAAFQLNQEDYDKWYAEQLGSGEELFPEYYSLEYESFKEYTPAYLELLMEDALKVMPDLKEDIGLATLGQGDFFDTAKKILSKNYKEVSFKEGPKLEETLIGEYEGEKILELVNMDAGYLNYREKQVGKLTVFGVYPGMNAEDAKKMLANFGFYTDETEEDAKNKNEQDDTQDEQNGTLYITGVGFDNRAVWLRIKSGTVVGISLSPYCAFVS